MIENYLTILEDSLQKKHRLLDEMYAISKNQAELLKKEDSATETFSMEDYDRTVEEKDILVQELLKLDEGFEAVYDKIKEELVNNKAQYSQQIKRIQELISRLTEKSVSLQAQESRNKEAMDQFFKKEREGLKMGRKSTKAVLNYYQSMSKSGVVNPQFLDKKK